MILYLLFFSPYLSVVCFLIGLLLLRRGNRQHKRTWLGMVMLLAAVGFAWLWMEYLLGGVIGRLVLCGIAVLAAWLVYRHLQQTGT